MNPVKKFFHTKRERTVVDLISFKREQFCETINTAKPNEIYNGVWSERLPFIVVKEYNEEGLIYFCNGWADKTPRQSTVDELYEYLRYQGMSESYFVENTLVEETV